jgi:conjugative transfer region protein TrbK
MRARPRLRRESRHAHHDVAALVLRAATLAFVAAAIALAVNQSRHDDETADIPPPTVLADLLAAELARCRTITPEQNAADDSCRRAWAESRRRFFAPSSSRSNTVTNDPAAASPIKSQDRLSSAGVQPDRDEAR